MATRSCQALRRISENEFVALRRGANETDIGLVIFSGETMIGRPERGASLVARLGKPMHAAPHQHCRVLGVDDDPDVADSLGAFLECLGVDARIVYSGADALAIIPAFRPVLVFLDIAMPVMNGLETACRIRELPDGKNLELIALTAWGDAATRQAAREVGFDDYVVKPMQIQAVEALIYSACSKAMTRGLDRLSH